MAGLIQTHTVKTGSKSVAWLLPSGAEDDCLTLLDTLQGILGVTSRSAVLERLVVLSGLFSAEVTKLNREYEGNGRAHP